MIESDSIVSPDIVNINPAIYDTIGMLSRVLSLPVESKISHLYPRIVLLCVDDVMSIIASHPQFDEYRGLLRDSITGMDYRGVGRVITALIDKDYPVLMKRLNSNEAEFELYKSVIIALVENIKSGEC